jgi:hypothetical protein
MFEHAHGQAVIDHVTRIPGLKSESRQLPRSPFGARRQVAANAVSPLTQVRDGDMTK